MEKEITHREIVELIKELHFQTVGSISDLRIELKGDIHRLDSRIDNVENVLEQMQKTQSEDMKAFTSVFVKHDHQLYRLERWRSKLSAS